MAEVDAALGPQSVHRALEILTLVVEQGPLPLSDIARGSGLPTSTTLRMLRALETWDYVSRAAGGQYSLGKRFVHSRVSAEGMRAEDLIDRSASIMQHLTAETEETSYLSVPGPAGTCTFLREVQSPLPVRYVGSGGWAGRTVSREGSISGEILDGRTPAEGYLVMGAVADPDTVTVIGSPIVAADGEIIAALSLAAPSFRITPDRAQQHGLRVKAAAAELSLLLSAL